MTSTHTLRVTRNLNKNERRRASWKLGLDAADGSWYYILVISLHMDGTIHVHQTKDLVMMSYEDVSGEIQLDDLPSDKEEFDTFSGSGLTSWFKEVPIMDGRRSTHIHTQGKVCEKVKLHFPVEEYLEAYLNIRRELSEFLAD